MLVASWKTGFEGLHKADAQKVADEIMQIGESVTPHQIVERAKDGNTELHKCFEWDDTKAAYSWRLQQARQVVCHLVIKQVDEEPKKTQIRVFHKTDNETGYKPVTFVVRDETEYQKLIKQVMEQIRWLDAKLNSLPMIKELVKDHIRAIEDALGNAS